MKILRSSMNNITCFAFELLVLVDVTEEPINASELLAQFCVNKTTYYVYSRKYLNSIIQWLLTYKVDFGIFTHQKKWIAQKILKKAIPHVWKQSKFLYSQKSCAIYNDYYVKKLDKINRHSMLIDFYHHQILYEIKNNSNNNVLIDENGNLKNILYNLKKIYSSKMLKSRVYI